MTTEQKDLLLKDLSARLPYGVNIEYTFKVTHIETNEEEILTKPLFLYSINTLDDMTVSGIDDDGDQNICFFSEVKPYLFPISSMTEEQKEEFNTRSLELQLKVIDDEIMYKKATEFEVDFYNKHHLDWRGLIPMGLALDATNLNIY